MDETMMSIERWRWGRGRAGWVQQRDRSDGEDGSPLTLKQQSPAGAESRVSAAI